MVIEAIVGIILFIGLAAFFYGPWQWVWSDMARQIIFERRDAIFDMAHAGKLSFKSQEYRTIRRSMEMTIRYSHEMTFPRILYLMVVNKIRGKAVSNELFAAIIRIDDVEVEKEVKQHVTVALLAASGAMLFKSPLTMFVVTLLVIAIKIVPALFGRVAGAAAPAGNLIQAEAEALDDFSLAA